MKITSTIISLCCVIFLMSCSKEDNIINEPNSPTVTTGVEFTEFVLVDETGAIYKPFLITDSVIHICLPQTASFDALTAKFKHNGQNVFCDSVLFVSGCHPMDFSDFRFCKKFRIVSSLGAEKIWSVMVYDLPVFMITTPDSSAIVSKTDRTEACIVKMANAMGEIVDLGTAGIRSRGGSSWLQDKKPYNIKFDEKQELMGLPKSKYWLLLANARYDRTQLHNVTAYQMARLTDFPWVQQGDFVEVILNGEHKGLYWLCEKIRTEKNRIAIEEMKSDDIDGGGFLLESYIVTYAQIEQNLPNLYPSELSYVVTDYYNRTGGWLPCKLGWEVKDPDEAITQSQHDYIYHELSYMESLIKDDNLRNKGNYLDYFDIETAINWFLVEEACNNEEASRTKNVYLYKENGRGKFKMGPPWDFDAWTFGNKGNQLFYTTEETLYFHDLITEAHFVNRLKEKWSVYKPLWELEIPSFIESQYERIRRSAARNELYPNNWHTNQYFPVKTHRQLINEMKDALQRQLEWMDVQISNM